MDFIYQAYYICHKTTLKRNGSYIKLPKLLKSEKTTITLKKYDEECLNMF